MIEARLRIDLNTAVTVKGIVVFRFDGNSNNDSGFFNLNFDDLDSSDNPILQATRAGIEGATFNGNQDKENDASDADMLWCALTGEERGTGGLHTFALAVDRVGVVNPPGH